MQSNLHLTQHMTPTELLNAIEYVNTRKSRMDYLESVKSRLRDIESSKRPPTAKILDLMSCAIDYTPSAPEVQMTIRFIHRIKDYHEREWLFEYMLLHTEKNTAIGAATHISTFRHMAQNFYSNGFIQSYVRMRRREETERSLWQEEREKVRNADKAARDAGSTQCTTMSQKQVMQSFVSADERSVTVNVSSASVESHGSAIGSLIRETQFQHAIVNITDGEVIPQQGAVAYNIENLSTQQLLEVHDNSGSVSITTS